MTCSVLLSLNWLTVKDSVIGIKKLLAWGSHVGFSRKNERHEKNTPYFNNTPRLFYKSLRVLWGSQSVSLFLPPWISQWGSRFEIYFSAFGSAGPKSPISFWGWGGKCRKGKLSLKSLGGVSLFESGEKTHFLEVRGAAPRGGCDLEIHVLPPCRSGVYPLGERSMIALLPLSLWLPRSHRSSCYNLGPRHFVFTCTS